MVASFSSAKNSFIRPELLWSEVGLTEGQRVCHLGCGPGFYLIPAAKIVGRGGRVIGVDVMSNLLAEAENRAQLERVSQIVITVRADLEQNRGSKLADSSVDWALVSNVLHQADPKKLLSEARRIIKEKGAVIVIEWKNGASPFGPPTEVRLNESDMLQIALQVGLKQERSFSPSPYHYGFIFSKNK
jgi:ubiquinone/menaquinone biosynthesis C-methylase UbiE